MLKELCQDLEKIAELIESQAEQIAQAEQDQSKKAEVEQVKIAEQNEPVEQVEQVKQVKQAGLYAVGDSIVCLNPIEGIVKGQKYRITRFTDPNYGAIEDVFGNEIGSFRLDRFCHDNNEY